MRLALLLALTGITAVADDIVPAGKFGYIVVTIPKSAESAFGHYQVTFFKDTEKRTPVTHAGKPFRVFAGQGCLSVRTAQYENVRCGYAVREKETTTIPLAEVKFQWDMATLAVHVSPFPGLMLEQTKQTYAHTNWSEVSFTNVAAKEQKYLLNPGSYEVTYGKRVGALANDPVKFSLSELESRVVDVTPPERRTEIIVTTSAVKYPSPRHAGAYRSNPIWLLERWTPQFPSKALERSVLYSETGILSHVVLPFPQISATPTELHYFAFAAAEKQARHELVVNNIVKVLTLEPGKTVRVDLVALNVHKIDETKKGFFEVYQRYPLAEAATPDQRRLNWFRDYNGWLYLEQDKNIPRVGDENRPEQVYHSFYTTEETLIVPRGWQYVVKAWAFDELGEFKLQSEHELDLR